MTDESLSALLDGECPPEQLDAALARLARDPALRRRLSRQVLAGEVMRGMKVRAADLDFADRVMARLDTAPVGAEVVPLAPRRSDVPWRYALGLAAAAGLGALAVLVFRPAAPAAAPVPVAAVSAPVPAAAIVEATERDWTQLDDANRRQLRNYLIAYSQSRAQQGMGGTLGYARYAAYTADGARDGSRR